MHNFPKKFFIIATLCCSIVLGSYAQHLNFSGLEFNQMRLPESFIFGCVHAKAGIQAPDEFEVNTIKLIKPLGLNGVSFDIQWKRVEPIEGTFDHNELDALALKCACLEQEGIKPVVYLFSGDAPEWFLNKGGFESPENIQYFVRYAKKVFERLHPHVHLWMTFYQPAGCALERYLRGLYPPYKKNMQLAIDVLSNMLEAHVQTYQAIKGQKLKGSENAQIGLAHHIYWLEPYHVINPFDQLAAYMGNRLNNKLVIEFFKTGECKFTVPFQGKKFFFNAQVNHHNPLAPRSIDFIGLIYQSHAYMKMFKTVSNPQEIATDCGAFTIYPQGLYTAIEYVSQLNVPIHIVSNGIADAKDAKREQFLKHHVYVASKAIADGFDVRSYFYRALESDHEDQLKFGLYVKDSKGNRSLQPSANYLARLIAHNKSKTIKVLG